MKPAPPLDLADTIRKDTKLSGGKLDSLLKELTRHIEKLNSEIVRPAAQQQRIAKQFERMAVLADQLVQMYEAHPTTGEGLELPTLSLSQFASAARRKAEDLRISHEAKATAQKGRPTAEGVFARQLATVARASIEEHCERRLRKANLRRSIDAVLRIAGYKPPNYKKDSAR